MRCPLTGRDVPGCWVPELGGPIDPANEAHDLVMSVFGEMSKGERNRMKIRVRSAMAAQAEIEGRFIVGRPPCGYTLVDAGPHPNPAKAADGKRLHALAPTQHQARGTKDLRRIPDGPGPEGNRRGPDPRCHPVSICLRPQPDVDDVALGKPPS